MITRPSGEQPDVLIVGGAVAGLAAADALANYASVTLYERESYDTKRVNCGEAINDVRLIPLEPTTENGFVNNIESFELEIHSDMDRMPGADPLASVQLPCPPGYICDRNVVERRWAQRLEQLGVTVRDGTGISIPEYTELITKYDYVIDATGQPSLTLRAFDLEHAYAGDMVALNTTIAGDFNAYCRRPKIFFEGYVGYAWSFPKSQSRANIGIGWAGEQRPDHYFSSFKAACIRNNLPVPDREKVNIYTIPKGPSLSPAYLHFPEEQIFLVGDAAGIANRYQGEGICQAIRSATLLANLIKTGQENDYPRQLDALMRSEYRLAHLMRGVWMEHHDPTLLAAVASALDGLTIEQITREPRSVVLRLLRHPVLCMQLFGNRGMLARCVDAYANTWEYTPKAASHQDNWI